MVEAQGTEVPPPPPPAAEAAQAPAPPPAADANAAYQAWAAHYAAYYGTYPPAPSAASTAAAPTGQAPAGQVPAYAGYDYSQYYAGYQQPHAHPQAATQYYSGYQQQQGYSYPAAWPAPPTQAAAAPSNGSHPPKPAAAAKPAPWASSPTVQAPPTQAWSGSYSAVPPPASLTAPYQQPGKPAHPFVIRPQGPRSRAAPVSAANTSPLVSSALPSAANALPIAKAPAYRSVAAAPRAPGAAAPVSPAGGAMNPQHWPPALRAYVERAFKGSPNTQRAKLQEVLRMVITQAQDKGELWTRDWDTLPLPDLTHQPSDAATLISEVAAVSTQGGGRGPSTGRTSAGAASAPRQQKQKQKQQQQQQQQMTQAQIHLAQVYEYIQQQKQQQQQQQAAKGGKGKGKGKSKKRAWLESESDSQEDVAPCAFAEGARRRKRAGRFGDGSAEGGRPKGGESSEARRARLTALLEDGADNEEVDWDAFAIKGTCKNVEKSYFRLTSAPDPSTVRPPAVLRLALDRLVSLVAGGEVGYFYAQDQFKGLRQDCVVQHIRGGLAAEVYEAHARAALEYGDVAEYNQCQGQVAVLHAEGAPSAALSEFLAYRLLYQAVHARHGEMLQLLNTLRRVTRADAAVPQVAHALRVRRAVAVQDYAGFFRLYRSAPGLGRALMDLAVPRLRFAALNAAVKAFKPSVTVDYLAALLGFVVPGVGAACLPGDDVHAGEGGRGGGGANQGEAPLPGCSQVTFPGNNAAKTDWAEGMAACLGWLAECGAVVTGLGAAASLDCKASAGLLRIPEEKDAVAHGDANLDIGDFLKSFDMQG